MQSLKQYFTRFVHFIRGQDVRNDRDQIKRFVTILGLAALLGVLLSPLAILATRKDGGSGQALVPTASVGAATTLPGQTPTSPLPTRPATSVGPVKGLTDNPAYQWWRWPNHAQPDSWWGDGQNAQTLGAQISLMQELGVKLFRPELVWSFVAPTVPGGTSYDSATARNPNWSGYHWDTFDRIVQLTQAAGIQLDPMVVYTPDWASGVRTTTSSGPNDPPQSAQYFGDFVFAAATRYKGEIHYWEMWNEPDYAPHTWNGTFQQYVDVVLKPGYQAVKQVDPTAQVIVGGLAGPTMGKIYAAGGGPYFDIGSFHAYLPASGGDAAEMDNIRGTMNQNGDKNKPLWMTEFGYQASNATSEAAQAQLIRSVYAGFKLQAIFFYQLHDTSVYDPGGVAIKDATWGLVSHDLLQFKPGFDAYKAAVGGSLPGFALGSPGGTLSPAVSGIWSAAQDMALPDQRQRTRPSLARR